MKTNIATVALAALASTGCAEEMASTPATWPGVAKLAVYMFGIAAIIWALGKS